MRRNLKSLIVVIGAAAVVGLGLQSALAEEANKQASIVGAELSTIANQLALRPETAIDFSKVSGGVLLRCQSGRWRTHAPPCH